MKHYSLFFIGLCLMISSTLFGQKNEDGPVSPSRLNIDPALKPFYHGVASGDPLSDAVIIWTRVTSDSLSVDVDWRIALDTGMVNIIDNGVVTTDASIDYTVKVDVAGLQPYTTYYYEFTAEGRNSIRGRTRTAPTGDIDSLRFAMVSCSSFGHGYFNVYRNIAERNDVDAILHLGDYIYEYADNEFGTTRNMVPTNEIITKDDYRMRHSHYKLDADLRALHQQYPFITTWDDHETANNSWYGGAENHNPGDGEGDWFVRKSVAIQAYHEWMPLRKPDPSDDERIYRKFSYGDLVDLLVLDTRLEGREEQGGNSSDPNRTMLGTDQYNWLVNEMTNSTAKWQVLAQQVMMAPLEIFGATINDDQWDGYEVERQNIYNAVLTNNVPNMVILTGDIHTSWANDLPLSGYDSGTGANSAGVEFVTPSVTSPGFPIAVGEGLVQALNPHMKFVDLDDKGYILLDLNKDRVQGDFIHISGISSPGGTDTYKESYYSNDGSRHLNSSSTPSVAPASVFTTPAPPDPRPNGMVSTSDPLGTVTVLGAYPNPFTQEFTLQYYVREAADFKLSIYNMTGKLMLQEDLGRIPVGIQRSRVQANQLPAGTYAIVLQNGNESFNRLMIKIK